MDKYKLIEQIRNNQIELVDLTYAGYFSVEGDFKFTFDEEDFDNLAKALLKNKTLKKLIFKTSSTKIEKLINKFFELNSKHVFGFYFPEFYNKITVNVFNSLKFNTTLVSLKITLDYDIIVDNFAEMLKTNKTITKLHLRIRNPRQKLYEAFKIHCNLTKLVLIFDLCTFRYLAIFSCLLNNFSLIKFKFICKSGNCYIRYESAKDFIQLIRQNKHLKYLYLNTGSITECLNFDKFADLKKIVICNTDSALLESVFYKQYNIKQLTLAGITNNVDNLIKLLMNCQFEILHLIHIKHLCIDHIISLLKHNTDLYDLNISFNEQLNNNLVELFDFLQTNTVLCKLNIRDIHLTNKDNINSLVNFIKINQTLIEFNLDCCLY